MNTLTDKLNHAWNNRLKTADFDLLQALEEVLSGVGLTQKDSGGKITVTGSDPVVESPLRIGGAASIALLTKSIAAAALHRWRGGEGQDISIDLRKTPHRLCPFYDRKWEKLGRYPVATTLEVGNIMGYTFFQCEDGRWVLPQAMYTGLRLGAQKLLGVPLTLNPVSEAIGRWKGLELEEAAAKAGVVMPMVRTLPEMLKEKQYTEVLESLPLIELTRIGDAEPEPLRPLGEQPFSGYRALGMGHVIAGAGMGRSLALHGADVLNLWRPGEGEQDPAYASANVGMRSSWLDPREDNALLKNMVKGTDIFFHNRRLGFMDEIGLSPEKAAEVRPGIIYVTISLHGLDGPWAGRPGFDQSAGSVTGMMALQGSEDKPELPPIMVVNDFLTPWLAQAGIVSALKRKAEEGGSWHVHISLTRVALWILSMGIFDKEWASSTAGSSEAHLYLDPETFTAETTMGDYQGVTDQVHMSGTPGHYDPVLIPRGSSRLEWRK